MERSLRFSPSGPALRRIVGGLLVAGLGGWIGWVLHAHALLTVVAEAETPTRLRIGARSESGVRFERTLVLQPGVERHRMWVPHPRRFKRLWFRPGENPGDRIRLRAVSWWGTGGRVVKTTPRLAELS